MKISRLYLILAVCVSGITVACCSQKKAEETAPSQSKSMTSAQLESLVTGKEKYITYVLIDVGTRAEYVSGHIPGAVNVPQANIAGEKPAEDKKILIIVYGRNIDSSAKAESALRNNGYQNVVNFGTISSWNKPLTKGNKER